MGSCATFHCEEAPSHLCCVARSLVLKAFFSVQYLSNAESISGVSRVPSSHHIQEALFARSVVSSQAGVA